MILRLIERTAVFLVSLAVSSVLVFAFMAILPGDPARVALGVNASDEAVAELRRQFGLDRPLPTQYFDWLGGLLHGDLGTSYVSKVAI
ncbi:MAG TPA: ABC transporter permease, partial [Kribbella sp.]|nr:ABC transporter permease [Kribbella sp.]